MICAIAVAVRGKDANKVCAQAVAPCSVAIWIWGRSIVAVGGTVVSVAVGVGRGVLVGRDVFVGRGEGVAGNGGENAVSVVIEGCPLQADTSRRMKHSITRE